MVSHKVNKIYLNSLLRILYLIYLGTYYFIITISLTCYALYIPFSLKQYFVIIISVNLYWNNGNNWNT